MAHLDRVLFSCQFCVNFKTKGLPKFLEHSEKVHFGGSMGSLKYQGLFQTNTSYFISLGNYKIKVEKSRKTKLKTCPFCQVSVKKSKLGQHIFYAHDRKCPKCPETKLKTHGEYLKHTKSRIHCTKMKMKCSNCEFETYLSQLFWEHRLLQHPEELIEAIPTPPLTPTLPE